MWAELWQLLIQQRRWLVLALLCGGLTLAAGLTLLAISGWFISATALAGVSVVSALSFDIFRPAALVRASALLRCAGRYAERLLSHDATLRLLAGLRLRYYQRLSPYAAHLLHHWRSGELLGRLVADLDSLDSLWLRLGAPLLLSSVLLLALSWALSYWLSAWAWLILALAGAWLMLCATLGYATYWHGQREQRLAARWRTQLVSALQGWTSLHLYGAWPRWQTRLQRLHTQWLARQRCLTVRALQAQAGLQLLHGALVLALLYVGITALQQQQLQPAELALGVCVGLGVLELLAAPLGGLLSFGRSYSALQRLQQPLQRPLPNLPQPSTILPEARGELRLRGVSFAYSNSRPLLQQAQLTLTAGGCYALIGASGSGKSTLAALLARIVLPQAGVIELDGVDLQRYSEAQLRQRLAYLPQQPHIFALSIEQNLRLANPHASAERLWQVLEQVGLGEWLASLPQGLATLAGEWGTQLSGGQARRLAVAQVLLREAAVMVLDEPTAGLDPAAARALLATLAEQGSGTRFIISHDPQLLGPQWHVLTWPLTPA